MHIVDWIFLVFAVLIFFRMLFRYVAAHSIARKGKVICRVYNFIGSCGGILVILGIYLLIRYNYFYDIGFDNNLRLNAYSSVCILLGISIYDYNVIMDNGIIIRGRTLRWADIKTWYWRGEEYIAFEYMDKDSKTGTLVPSRVDMLIPKRQTLDIEAVLKQHAQVSFKDSIN